MDNAHADLIPILDIVIRDVLVVKGGQVQVTQQDSPLSARAPWV